MNEEYVPTQNEIYEALEDARRMNANMRRFGTIDVPKQHTLQSCQICEGSCFVRDMDCGGTGVGEIDPC